MGRSGAGRFRAARPTVFDVTLPFLQGAGLFADLAAGRSLGDIILTSRDDQRRLYQSWTLEDAVSCNT